MSANDAFIRVREIEQDTYYLIRNVKYSKFWSGGFLRSKV